MASPIPTQERIVDPFASYNSNIVNRITEITTQGSNGLLTTNSLQVSSDSTSPVDTVVVSTGYAVKDDVLINITAEHRVDFTDNDNYTGTPMLTAGYYYIVLDYTYAKSRPAPQASIKILTPTEVAAGAYSLGSQYLLLKVVEVSIPSGIQIDALHDYDPTDSTITREYLRYYAGTAPLVPTFNANRDQSRMLYASELNKFYFGYESGWGELSAGGVALDVNTDTTGVDAGYLCYVDENRDCVPAIATGKETGADLVVLSVGTAISGSGRGSIAGFVEEVPVETGVLIDIGDLLYLSDTEPGKVTNTQTFPVFQVVGRALSQGSSTTPIDMIFSPKVPLALNIEGQVDSWIGPDGNGDYYHDINVSGLDGTNAFICSWFDNSTKREIVPSIVEIRNNGLILRVYMPDSTSVLDYVISSGQLGAASAGGGGGGTVSDHALLTSLDFASSGHTGFAPTPHGNTHHSATYITASDVTYNNLNANGDVGTGATQVAQGDHLHAIYAPTPHDNSHHSATYITASGVTYGNLNANGDVGTGSTQVARGNHTHSSLYAPLYASAGNYIEVFHLGAIEDAAFTRTTPVKRVEFQVGRPGTYRITWEQISRVTQVTYVRVYRNGSPVGSTQSAVWNGNCDGWTTKSQDISGWSTGDLLQIYVWWSSQTGSTYCGSYNWDQTAKEIMVKTSNPLVCVDTPDT